MDGIHKESTCVFNPLQAHQVDRIPVETQEMKLFSEMPPTELWQQGTLHTEYGSQEVHCIAVQKCEVMKLIKWAIWSIHLHQSEKAGSHYTNMW